MKKIVRYSVAALACIAGLTGPALAQSSKLRALDRDYTAVGWEAVGRLDTGVGFCTGTLIAPHLVLTAAHCVYDMRNGEAIAPEQMRFRAGYRDGEAVATRQAVKVAAHPNFAPSGDFNKENVSFDLALVQLGTPIPSSEVDAFVLHDDTVEPGEVSIVSYGADRAEVQSRQRGCQMIARQDALLAFDCDVTKGSSGAPVFSHLNGRGRILSVISGEVDLDGREVALGMHLPPLIGTLKRDLAAQAGTPVAQQKRVKALGVNSGRISSGSSEDIRPSGSGKRRSNAKFQRVPSKTQPVRKGAGSRSRGR